LKGKGEKGEKGKGKEESPDSGLFASRPFRLFD
jgi:hypothetical protein